MRLRIWGCRGSVPTPGEEALRYGGNTPCVEVTVADEAPIILDAGTGIRKLGLTLAARDVRALHLCLTHLHLDHLEGLRFFAPLWDERTDLHVWGPPSHLMTLRERIARSFSPPLFPIDLADVPARLHFHDTPDRPWSIGSARLQAASVIHPGPTLGYRIEAGGSTLAYVPDHEPALGPDPSTHALEWLSGSPVAAAANVLLHDAQFTEAEYRERIGWGHSSVVDTVAYARACRVGELVLFHHDPLHGDADLDALAATARSLWDGSAGKPPTLAYEGMSFVLADGLVSV